jgi:PKD repeat protein
MRSRLLLLTAVGMLCLCGVAQAATTTVIDPPAISLTLAPMKLKGYTVNVGVTKSKVGSLSVSLQKGVQSHNYFFSKKANYGLQLTKNLTAGTLTANLGSYGHLKLHLLATGPLHLSKPGKGCTGPKLQSRAFKVSSASGGVVLDHSFFHTLTIGHIKGTASKSGKLKCKFSSTPQPPGVQSRTMSVLSNKIDATFTAGAHSSTAAITVTTSSNPIVNHSLSLRAPASSFVMASDASSATVRAFGALLTGTGTYTASQYFSNGSSGALTGTLVAHFDSIGAQKIVGTTAYENVPGFNPPPTADFTDSPGSPGQVDFFDNSSDPAGKAFVAWGWNFGDGQTSAQENPLHTYATSGTYQVTLTVTDANGQKASITHSVSVTANQPPTASFTWDNSNGGGEVDFNDTSTDPDGSVEAWSWNFGDGQTSSQEFPTHVYSTPGTYTVTLTVTDDSGAQNTTSQSVTALP